MNLIELFNEGMIDQDDRGICYSQIDDYRFAYHDETGFMIFNEDSGEWELFNTYEQWVQSEEGKKYIEGQIGGDNRSKFAGDFGKWNQDRIAKLQGGSRFDAKTGKMVYSSPTKDPINQKAISTFMDDNYRKILGTRNPDGFPPGFKAYLDSVARFRGDSHFTGPKDTSSNGIHLWNTEVEKLYKEYQTGKDGLNRPIPNVTNLKLQDKEHVLKPYATKDENGEWKPNPKTYNNAGGFVANPFRDLVETKQKQAYDKVSDGIVSKNIDEKLRKDFEGDVGEKWKVDQRNKEIDEQYKNDPRKAAVVKAREEAKRASGLYKDSESSGKLWRDIRQGIGDGHREKVLTKITDKMNKAADLAEDANSRRPGVISAIQRYRANRNMVHARKRLEDWKKDQSAVDKRSEETKKLKDMVPEKRLANPISLLDKTITKGVEGRTRKLTSEVEKVKGQDPDRKSSRAVKAGAFSEGIYAENEDYYFSEIDGVIYAMDKDTQNNFSVYNSDTGNWDLLYTNFSSLDEAEPVLGKVTNAAELTPETIPVIKGNFTMPTPEYFNDLEAWIKSEEK